MLNGRSKDVNQDSGTPAFSTNLLVVIDGTPLDLLAWGRTNSRCGTTPMKISKVFLVLISVLVFPILLLSQQSGTGEPSTASCTFTDGKSVTAQYHPVPSKKADLPNGHVWMPGGSALTLFAETAITLNGAEIPTGGYTMYLVPGRKEWTLIVSKNTDVSKLDKDHDVAHSSMQTGELNQAEPNLSISFGHVAPNACEINVDFGKTRAWTEFKEK